MEIPLLANQDLTPMLVQHVSTVFATQFFSADARSNFSF